MPQNSNLNVSPYFDDFDENNNYKRVLFKPGTPIQARELTTLQSILQNQIEKFGSHFFKEGAMVIPGQIAYDNSYTSVQINETHLGIPVSVYIDKLVGKRIKGETSGVIAKVENYITSVESEKSNYTLYIKYISSDPNQSNASTFIDGENLITLSDIDYMLSGIRQNETFATTILSNSINTGSAAKITEGVYFIRGFFIKVPTQTVILDQYSNTPSYRVGLSISEEFAVASNDYNDLYDNAKGFSNFAAPGADRLKVSVELIKKDIEDFNDENFVELLRVRNGNLEKFVDNTEYNQLEDELARRTYDESGDYFIRPFKINIKESLNDKLGNNGIYEENQRTINGNLASDDLACISISPGKAYVRGYEIETENVLLDLEKPRDTRRVQNENIQFNFGNQIIVNNVYGSIPVGFSTESSSTESEVKFYNDRTDTKGVKNGTLIGISKVYDYEARSSEYVGPQTEYVISLYDTQLFTKIKLNSNISITTPALIEGQNSGARGFLYSNVSNGRDLTLYDVSGSFNLNEPITISGSDNNRIITEINDYKVGDVHQIVANENNVSIGTFTSDTVLSRRVSIRNGQTGTFSISAGPSGISTITSPNINYSILSVGDIISYTKPSGSLITYNKIIGLNQTQNTITIQSVSDVDNVCDGTVPTTSLIISNILKVEPSLLVRNNNFYSELNNENISNVDLTNTSITIKRTFNDVEIFPGESQIVYELANNVLSFEAFDEENYNFTYVNTGTVVPLVEFENIRFSQDRKFAYISNFPETGPVLFTATCKINTTTSRKKLFNRCNSLTINLSESPMSGVGTTTLNDGLTFSRVYGRRVQDREISLNVPDVVKILGIYESSDTTNPKTPRLILSNLSSSILNIIKGEKIIGSLSNAVGYFVGNLNNSTLEFVEANDNDFIIGENVLFEESQITANIQDIINGDKNITSSYRLDNGYRKEYLDFSRIIRKDNFSSPNKRIRIIFNNYTIPEGNVGDFVVVNSYDADRYKSDLPIYRGIYSSDIIDVRPAVLPYSGNRSPFESISRKFTNTSGSSPHIFSKNTTLNISYDHYLPRIDKLFLDKNGNFILNSGIPSITPALPQILSNAIEVATFNIPAYLRNVRDVDISIKQHKRYTMKDISKLEDKLNNIEQYTLLSMLEQDTRSLTLRDEETGLDKFKSGFLVDNFRSVDGGDIGNVDYKSDSEFGTLRSSSYITSIDLIAGIGATGSNVSTTDYFYNTNLGTNDVKKVGNILCLNYRDVEYLKNPFATRTENINPFNIITWTGILKLNPSSDNWLETRRTGEDKILGTIEGNYLDTLRRLNANPNTGLSPIQWEAWKTAWTGVIGTSSSRNIRNVAKGDKIETITTTNTIATNQIRAGTQFQVREVLDTISLGDRVVSNTSIGFMRSRNIEIVAKRLKPISRLYAFFDNKNVTEYIVPKLIDIRMVSGSFEAGEIVTGVLGAKQIRFRLAPQNHKYGPVVNSGQSLPPNYEVETYRNNIYSPSDTLSRNYSTTSRVLNVDTASLGVTGASEFFGAITKNMRLIGTNSKAVAIVNDLRLISDDSGTFIGTLFIPDSRNPSVPKFETGTKELVLTTSSTNSKEFAITSSYGTANFTSSGVLQSLESTSLRIRNAAVDPLVRTDTNQIITNTTTTTSRRIRHTDPLAQSFLVEEESGIFITKCDVFFATKDTNNIPVTLQIRTMELGTPTQTILPFGEIILSTDKIKTSSNGRVATTFFFESPVYLEGGKEYAIVLISPSDEYTVWISRMGEDDITSSALPENDRIIVSQQPLLGSLFKSQNASTWSASQLEDLKFVLYRAQFTSTNGSVRLYNSDLNIGNQQINTLPPNPIQSYSRSMIVSIGKTFTNSDIQLLTPGSTITQQSNSYFRSDLVSVVGSIGVGTTLEIIDPGTGFGSITTTYTDVDLISLTGLGNGAKATISVSSGVATTITVTQGGTGYINGDALIINVNKTDDLGRDLIISIPNEVGIITEFNSLLLDNVQGFINTNTQTNIICNGTTIQSSPVNSPINLLSDGLHMKISHENHGMYSYENFVTISGIEPDILPVKLESDISSSSSVTSITVSDITPFITFENLPVNSNNPGYILINREIIRYTGVNENDRTLTGVTRSNTSFNDGDDPLLKITYYPETHFVGSNVFKYEFNGISLRRINRTHNMNLVDKTKYPIEIDSYHVKLDMSSTDSKNRAGGVDPLFFIESKFGGTNTDAPRLGFINSPKATQNILMTSILPNIETLLPENTRITAKIRTTTGTSISGNEKSFRDSGFINISLDSETEFDTPRLICSKINESEYLKNLPGSKSLTMELTLSTSDNKISPIIDLDRVNIATKMNRINSPITNYITDNRVNQIGSDPHSAIYVSRLVRLENPANELKVYFDAYRHSSNDVRVAYKLIRDNIPEEQQIYELFPGYRNLDQFKNIRNSSRNDGSSDILVNNSINISDYKSYEYTAKNIPLFNGFQIKIMMSSKNQCISPLIRNFRAIAAR